MATPHKEDWYSRAHPERAASERSLRRERRDRDKAHRNRNKQFDRGTPETAQKAGRVRQGALARLYQAGHLSADQLASSQEIRQIAEMLTRDVHIGTTSVETRVDNGGRGSGAFFEKLGTVRAEIAYTRWRAELSHPGPVLAMIVQDEACRNVARRSGMRDATARKLLSEALDAWPGIMGLTCKTVGPADLLAMQAGLY
ncbi:hypothetical protein [Qipengyuania sp.]|uniref:hypothetical protein n=1 Tax=Qipengyuania sp. TaxID=2004515 RepID=UPI0035C790C2